MASDPTKVTWREFFDAHAPRYMENVFTQWTTTEVTFLEKHLPLQPGMRVLDMGCGTGRHAVELAKRGYQVTGVDISPGMLSQAEATAKKAGVSVEFIEANATNWSRPDHFDAAICLCEGGFGLADIEEQPVQHDLAILRNIHLSLRPKGPFILTALNGYAIIRRMTDEHVKQGSFDPETMVARYLDEMALPEGRVVKAIQERLFIAPELVAMMRYVGFDVRHVWGGTAGEWGDRPIKLDEIEMMIVAAKTG